LGYFYLGVGAIFPIDALLVGAATGGSLETVSDPIARLLLWRKRKRFKGEEREALDELAKDLAAAQLGKEQGLAFSQSERVYDRQQAELRKNREELISLRRTNESLTENLGKKATELAEVSCEREAQDKKIAGFERTKKVFLEDKRSLQEQIKAVTAECKVMQHRLVDIQRVFGDLFAEGKAADFVSLDDIMNKLEELECWFASLREAEADLNQREAEIEADEARLEREDQDLIQEGESLATERADFEEERRAFEGEKERL